MIYFEDIDTYIEDVIGKCNRLDRVVLRSDNFCDHDFTMMNRILTLLSLVPVLNHLIVQCSNDSWLENPDSWTKSLNWKYTLNLSCLEIYATNKGELNQILQIHSKTLRRVKITAIFEDDFYYNQLEYGLFKFLKVHKNTLTVLKLDVRCEKKCGRCSTISDVQVADLYKMPHLKSVRFNTENLQNSKLLALFGKLLQVSNLKKQKLGREIVDFMILHELKSTTEKTKFIDKFTDFMTTEYKQKLAHSFSI